MAKTKTEGKQESSGVQEILATLCQQYKSAGFDKLITLTSSADEEAAAIVWGQYQGVETPRIFLLALAPGNWDKANAEYVQQKSYTLPPADTKEDEFPQFAVVSDGEHKTCFELSFPAYEIDRLPTLKEINEYKRIKADPTYRWSMKMYDRLMRGFDEFHEQVYQNVRDNISSSNDIIREVTKILFLESFRLHHEGSNLEFQHDNQTLNLNQIFNVAYIKKQGKKAVAQIQAAFDHFKSHADYVVTDDNGESHAIFDEQTHLRLGQPRNYETLLDLIQNLGAVTNNYDQVVKTQGTLADIAADVLGRLLDVFLRAKFKPEGMGVYLTPAPVKQAMLAIAFHDIKEETPELLTARDEEGKPLFRFCDPACGSYGFGAVAMGYLERALLEILGKETSEDVRRDKLFQDMCQYSFIGADNSQDMVTLARVNMALLGAPKAKIFRTYDSLITAQFKPCSYDLICTNPPFGTPKFSKGQEKAKKSYEEAREKILQLFRSDLVENPKKAGTYTYEPSVSGLAMGGKPDSKGLWKPVSASIDPAVLFIDRCLQMLKPGGRLLIVLPDGVLCNSGDKYVREYIMGTKDEATGQFHGGKAIVKAVISLPSDTFKLSGTGAKTSILYLQKRQAREQDPQRFQDVPQPDVFMAVADTLGYLVKNNVEDYSTGVTNDLAAIVGAYVRGE
ncbi:MULTISPECIES: HsdM family class I SAM-dependent methyltransferase [Calothrix]|uniref:N-6 DNA methylase n=2 Tax=Calothrix TaxID=1186 RepID=A0ABR8AEU6_9CYAN|nr:MULTISPECIES: N-6 DNA methylase [Calothrix]MBD2198557.1 N-6 DNA methylase [Calothrix parietina FACHB-288]MBD2226988.1 N-6 DNA methylase [Calothrix anomala FACHB-343]